MLADQDVLLFEFAAGEDLVVQFIWLDEQTMLPIAIQPPAILTLRSGTGGEMVFHDYTYEGISPASDPFLNLNPDMGLIQASAPAEETAQLAPGNYNMDLWVYARPNAEMTAYPIASQLTQICRGRVTVHNPITIF